MLGVDRIGRRCNIETISRPETVVCDVIHGQIMLQRMRLFMGKSEHDSDIGKVTLLTRSRLFRAGNSWQ